MLESILQILPQYSTENVSGDFIKPYAKSSILLISAHKYV